METLNEILDAEKKTVGKQEVSKQILDAAEKTVGKQEVSELAKVISVGKTTVSTWRTRGSAPDTADAPSTHFFVRSVRNAVHRKVKKDQP